MVSSIDSFSRSEPVLWFFLLTARHDFHDICIPSIIISCIFSTAYPKPAFMTFFHDIHITAPPPKKRGASGSQAF